MTTSLPSFQPYDLAREQLMTLCRDITSRQSNIDQAVALSEDWEGLAAEAARMRFRGLRTSLERTRREIEHAGAALWVAHACELACTAAIRAASPLGTTLPETSGFIAMIQLERARIDRQVAAALALLSQQIEEPNLALLGDDPGAPLSHIHARNSAVLSPDARSLVQQHSGVILESGPGGIAVLLGTSPEQVDVIEPRAINTVVAGVGSSEPGALANYLDRGSTLARGTDTPTVIWLGYTAPEDILFDSASESFALEGADNLSYFQAALSERFPAATRTVLAHSYGTVVAAEAAKTHGLFADNLVFMGSPGVNALHVDQLHLHSADPGVYVADTYDDPIQWLRNGSSAFFGANPASPHFGAQRLPGIGGGGHSGHWTSNALHKAIREMNS